MRQPPTATNAPAPKTGKAKVKRTTKTNVVKLPVSSAAHAKKVRAQPKTREPGNDIAWRMLSTSYVRGLNLKANFDPKLTAGNLKNCLRAARFSKELYPKVPAQSWRQLLSLMIHNAERLGHNTERFKHWFDTRNSRKVL